MINITTKERSLQAALFLCLVFGALTSCTRPEHEIGRELQPSSDIFNLITVDTLTLALETQVQDTLNTQGDQLMLLGSDSDPSFGRTDASIFSQMIIPSNGSYDFTLEEGNVVLDDINLYLKFNPDMVGEPGSYRVIVEELAEEILSDTATSYTNISSLEVVPGNLVRAGNQTVYISPNNVLSGVNGESTNGLLKIPLDEALGERFLTAETEQLTAAGFVEFFKGIKVQVQGDPLMMAVDLLNPEAGISLEYREVVPGLDDVEKEAVFNFVNARRFNQRLHDYSQSTLAGIEDANVDASEYGYVQGANGLQLMVKVPFIADLDPDNDLIINRAELILETETPSTSIGTNFSSSERPIPLASLFLVSTYNDEGLSLPSPDYALTSDFVDAAFNPDSSHYSINLTRHLQRILNGTSDSAVVFIRPLNPDYSTTTIFGPDAPTDRKSRLVLTYSN